MNEKSPKDSNQHGHFNLLHEDLRGAMYRGGAERDAVITGHVLTVVILAVYAAIFIGVGTLLRLFGIHLGDVIAVMARERPLLLIGAIALTFIGCMVLVFTIVRRIANR